MTSASTLPKINRSSGPRVRRQTAMTADEIHATTKDNCLADSSAFFLSFCPMYWEQTIVPPAASA